MKRLETSFYWHLPSPYDLVDRVARATNESRLAVINTPLHPPLGFWEQIRQGVKSAHRGQEIVLRISEGASIGAEVGTHLDPGGADISPARLATTAFPTDAAFILRPDSEAAQSQCEEYAYAFLAALSTGVAVRGNCRLLVIMHQNDLPEGAAGHSRVVRFDGGLDELSMQAYVGLCMATRGGPGGTRLAQAIVSAFAGFDATFATRLMDLDEAALLEIRSALGSLFDEYPARWRVASWLQGTWRKQDGAVSGCYHTLHDYYLSRYALGEEAEAARRRLDKRYWRACVRAITPWLEEHRHRVLAPFMADLRLQAANSEDGKLAVRISERRSRGVEPSELEYNALIAQVDYAGLRADTLLQRQALAVARAAKSVRDSIAHLRPPAPRQITQLVFQMEALIAAGGPIVSTPAVP